MGIKPQGILSPKVEGEESPNKGRPFLYVGAGWGQVPAAGLTYRHTGRKSPFHMESAPEREVSRQALSVSREDPR